MSYILTGADGRPYESDVKGQWGGHRGTKIYGRLDCPSALRAIARGGYARQRVFFAHEATAIAAGYRPCATCCRERYDAWKAGRGSVIDVPTQVRIELAGPRILAAVRAVTTPRRLGTDIIRCLDQVWPLLREQSARTGHNVVVYHAGESGELVIDAGVEVPDGFAGRGTVRRVDTPGGEVAVAAHYGDYADLSAAYAALEQWCTANGRHQAGPRWEVYGDWDDDPARRRTDVYFLLQPLAGP
jgi:predicted transcriptional regulator YdeE